VFHTKRLATLLAKYTLHRVWGKRKIAIEKSKRRITNKLLITKKNVYSTKLCKKKRSSHLFICKENDDNNNMGEMKQETTSQFFCNGLH